MGGGRIKLLQLGPETAWKHIQKVRDNPARLARHLGVELLTQQCFFAQFIGQSLEERRIDARVGKIDGVAMHRGRDTSCAVVLVLFVITVAFHIVVLALRLGRSFRAVRLRLVLFFALTITARIETRKEMLDEWPSEGGIHIHRGARIHDMGLGHPASVRVVGREALRLCHGIEGRVGRLALVVRASGRRCAPVHRPTCRRPIDHIGDLHARHTPTWIEFNLNARVSALGHILLHKGLEELQRVRAHVRFHSALP